MRCVIWDENLSLYENFKDELTEVCELNLAGNMEQLQEALGQGDVKAVFIKLELGVPSWEGIQSNFKLQMPDVKWVLFSETEDATQLTEHQNSPQPADGYLIGPLTAEMIQDYIEDIIVLEQTLGSIDASEARAGSEAEEDDIPNSTDELDLDFDSDTNLKVQSEEEQAAAAAEIQSKFDSVLGASEEEAAEDNQIGELTGSMVNLAVRNMEVDEVTDGKGMDIDATNIFAGDESLEAAGEDGLELEFPGAGKGDDIQIDTHDSPVEEAQNDGDIDLGFSDQTSVAKVSLGLTETEQGAGQPNETLNDLDKEKDDDALSLNEEVVSMEQTSSYNTNPQVAAPDPDGTMTETSISSDDDQPSGSVENIELGADNQELSMLYQMENAEGTGTAATGTDTQTKSHTNASGSIDQSFNSLNVITEDSALWKKDDSQALAATLSELKSDRAGLLKEISALKEENAVLRRNELTYRTEIEDSKVELELMKNRMLAQNQDLKFQVQLIEDKKNLLEKKTKDYREQYQKLTEKVQREHSKVRERESELAGQLDLLKQDSKAQIENRENKIIDLKRKIDNLEFNIENIAMKEERSKQEKMDVEQKMNKVISSLRFSLDVLESDSDDSDKVQVLNKLKSIG